ncbi:MAG: thioredoxin-disulfide reductase [Armatimonadota bacterium]|nr:thioredoxin-disulfide reductase [Armatimonadota bacterium]
MSAYDVIIIGGGPGGMTAAIYAARARLNTLLVEKLFPGGQLMISDFIENYPGFASGISGPELSAAMREQAEKFGMETLLAEVESVDFSGPEKIIKTSEGDVRALTVIISTGATARRLNVPGEAELLGRGVSYCATCDGAFFKDKDLVVVGGGDTAVEDSIFLTKYASKVSIVHRRDALRAAKIIQERALNNPKIEVIWNSVVERIAGNHQVQSVHLRNVVTGDLSELPADGVFILIGAEPELSYLGGAIVTDNDGYIIADENMNTSVAGVYVAGDIRQKSLRQIVTACADGAIAAMSAEKYIEAMK